MNDTKSQKEQLTQDGGTSGLDADGTLAAKWETDRFAKGFDFLLINRDIGNGLFPEVMGCVSQHKKNNKVVLILVTYGGVANEAYRVARYLQSVYDEVVAFVPSICKSAGTLMVTAAHSVVISPFGEIGPLDVQLLQKDEIFGRRSGLTTRSALDDLKTHTFELFQHFMLGIVTSSSGAVSFRLASDISSRIASEVMSRIYEQINPDALGQDFRDLNVATKYCERLNKKSRNLKTTSIDRLVNQYPSHDFVIDLEEAKELFERVSLPSDTLWNVMASRKSDMIVPKSGRSSLVEMLPPPSLPTKVEEPITVNTENPAEVSHESVSSQRKLRRKPNGEAATP